MAKASQGPTSLIKKPTDIGKPLRKAWKLRLKPGSIATNGSAAIQQLWIANLDFAQSQQSTQERPQSGE